ncbi:hypothetical protein LR48_Vigan561s000400 [Vigna angularis]|uniref:Uncharacterized protein n=1 Tax=Phaseolus angularis TaxID=3914 RepID=A0A0L9TEP1_PHAAN|nr:hypothetical protein LR48_Vigan561s000400 [Vigna angularis]
MIGAFIRVTGAEVVAASSLAQKIGSFSVLNRGVGDDSPAGSMVVPLVAASANRRDSSRVRKRGRRFRPAASSVCGVVDDALGWQKRGAMPRVGRRWLLN